MLITLDVSHSLNTLIGVYILDDHLNGEPPYYGGSQLSHQNQMLTANSKSLTSNSNRSHQIQITHSKFKSLTANYKSLTANYKSPTANSNRSQQINVAHSKFKLLTSNYKLLTPVGVFGYLQPAVQLV